MGRIYQQTFLDTYTKLAFAKLYDRKTPLVAADLLNDRVIPFFDEHQMPLQRVLTDRGTEYCGAPEIQVQLQRVALLRDMIEWCIENPVKGKTMTPNDERLRALEAYIQAQRKGVALDYGKH